MAWPQPTDFHEAIQNPGACFKDPELRSGSPLLDPLGLPRAILGNFASVYQIMNGSRKYAVRCFLTYHQDQERRYQAISSELSRLHLPFTVGFLFEREGILVKGKWYPILRMDWVEATPLTAYIEAHLSSPPKLLDLAERFLACVHDLQTNGLAHGDLQHGNILVTGDGSIKLIDYDGMYVPALEGMGSHELGHSNYQHPGRDEFKAYGPAMDNFSAWVITASLLALCFDPFLWFQVHGGDERLLFSKTDFSNPAASEIFTTMKSSPYPKVADVGEEIRKLLLTPADQVPPVTPTLISGVSVPASVKINTDPSAPLEIDTTPGGGDAVPIEAAGAAWVLDHLAPPEPVQFAGSMLIARLMTLVWIAATAFAGWAETNGRITQTLAGSIAGAALFILVAVLILDFRRREERRTRNERSRKVRELKGQLRNLERGLDDAKGKKHKTQEQEKTELQALAKRIGDVTTKENDAVRRTVDETQKLIGRQQRELKDAFRKEQEALSAALKRIQDAHVDQVLRGYSLQSASISGIGDSLKRKLAAAGVRTAADILDWRKGYVSSGYRSYTKEVAQLNIGGNWRRVDGIGPVKAADLVAWRNSRASAARSGAPKQLAQAQRDQISQQYLAQRTSLERQIALAEQQQQQKVGAVRQGANQERQGLERQVAAVKSKYAGQYGTMNTEIQRRGRDVATIRWRFGEAERALLEYRGITTRRYALAVMGRR